MVVLAEIMAWVATAFRCSGMLVKSADLVKALVSIGNWFWFMNGVLTSNVPLMVSNGACLLMVLFDILKKKD